MPVFTHTHIELLMYYCILNISRSDILHVGSGCISVFDDTILIVLFVAFVQVVPNINTRCYLLP